MAVTREQIEKDFQSVMATSEGSRVLAYIMHESGYHDGLLSYSTERELNVNASLFNMARRTLWCDLREFLEPEQEAKLQLILKEQKKK